MTEQKNLVESAHEKSLLVASGDFTVSCIRVNVKHYGSEQRNDHHNYPDANIADKWYPTKIDHPNIL